MSTRQVEDDTYIAMIFESTIDVAKPWLRGVYGQGGIEPDIEAVTNFPFVNSGL